jgi:hypothetical protein
MSTELQKTQQRNRRRSGQYATSEPCELCGKPAGHDYASLSTANTDGIGLTLCLRKGCGAGLTENEIWNRIVHRRHGPDQRCGECAEDRGFGRPY